MRSTSGDLPTIANNLFSYIKLGHLILFTEELYWCMRDKGARKKYVLELELEQWREALEKRGMKVSRSKTEYLYCVWMERNFKVQSDQLPLVTEFKYMGSTLQSDGDMNTEVNKRTLCAWNNWRKMLGSCAIREYHHARRESSTRWSFSQLCCTGWRQCQLLAPTWRNWKWQKWRCAGGHVATH